MRTRAFSTNGLKDVAPVVYLLLLGIGLFSITAGNFFSIGNAANILRQASPLLVLAIGETVVILIGEIDLSIGYIMSFTGLVAAYMMMAGWPLAAVVVVSILIAGAFGFMNGILVAKTKLPSFIATFGLGNVVFGLGLLISGGVSVPALDEAFRFLADGAVLGIPIVILITLGLFLLVQYFMRYTSFGRNVYGLGGNREALFLSGVKIDPAVVSVFLVSGLFAGCAGVMFASRVASGHAGSGVGWEFDAIAATIIGGNSFTEGHGNILKTVLGVLFITLLKNGLNMSGVAPQIQSFLVGVIVVLAISIDVMSRKAK
jgi:ribose transport system permease protein